MKIHFKSLRLQCRQAVEPIDLSSHISVFHGKIGSGKSSIARLIDYCLGGNLEKTPAIKQELIAVALNAIIGENQILLEREVGSNQIQATWSNEKGISGSALVPAKVASETSVWGDNVHNVSDLIFFLANMTPPKVRKSKVKEDSDLIRLSMREFMWYCYLEQNALDSSFFYLGLDEEFARRLKSRDVLRFVLGYYSEELNEFEVALEKVRHERRAKLEAATKIREFLERFELESEGKISDLMQTDTDKLSKLKSVVLPEDHDESYEPHPTDELRSRIRDLGNVLESQEVALKDLVERISEQEALRAELTSAKMKLGRSVAASSLLSGVRFQSCPACGTPVRSSTNMDEHDCYLCHQDSIKDNPHLIGDSDLVNKDLSQRIEELTDSINRHVASKRKLCLKVNRLRKQKSDLDSRLDEMLAEYDSRHLARAKKMERSIATLEERIRSYERLLPMPRAVEDLEKESDSLRAEEERLKREIQNEINKLRGAEANIEQLELDYANALELVGLPGLENGVKVKIDRKTWIPQVLPQGNESIAYGFQDVGSGGMKVLLKVLFALSLHKVAADRGLPMPSFLVIDTPMKNVGKEKNKDLFEGFYRYLYELANSSLAEIQLILIDTLFIGPQDDSVKVCERYMTPDDPENPPLITYYHPG